jgi:serine/threonine-protein kinase
VPILMQLLDGLGAAHRTGVLHRDLKPENIFLLHSKAGHKDFVKIIDFGISKFEVFAGGDDAMHMTATGTVVGTPCYLSPEQARGDRNVDARCDLYAVGVILYEMLSGRVPFESDTFNALLFKIALATPTPVEQLVSEMDGVMAGIVSKAMAKTPADRFQSAAEFAAALAAWSGGAPLLAPRETAPAPVLPGSRVGTPDPGAPWSGQPRVGSAATPTPSTFGASQLAQPGRRSASRAPTFVVAGLLGCLVLGGLALAAKRIFWQSPAPQTSAAVASASPPPAAAPRLPGSAAPGSSGADVSPVTSGDAGAGPPVAHEPEPPAAPPRRAAIPRPVRASTPSQTNATPLAPAPAASTKPRRDFGY